MSEKVPPPLTGAHPTGSGRQALRARLIATREAQAASPQAGPASEALSGHLARLLAQLEPDLLGLYVPMRGEFNAIGALDGCGESKLRLALPFAQRRPAGMHYRPWQREPLDGVDDCGIPAPGAGPAVVPDVVLVPCVAFTRSGYRLGYGGGYFDRWLAQHPAATAVGIAWSDAEVSEAEFAPQAHDLPLALVLTERGVVS